MAHDTSSLAPRFLIPLILLGCSSSSSAPGEGNDGGTAGNDTGGTDEEDSGTDEKSGGEASPHDSTSDALSAACTVTAVDAACPTTVAPPAGSTCKEVTITACPDTPSDTIGAIIAIVEPTGAAVGTIVQLKGGGGEGWYTLGSDQYRSKGFRQVFVSWKSDWEQTTSAGIKAGAARPAALLRWIFTTIHGADRSKAFCGQGHSGGSAQLGYALAHYGLGDIFDYVNELAGPPFSRIDLGCDGNAPATAVVCDATVTMRLPSKVGSWENIPAPYTCGGTDAPPSEIDRWKNDSIAVGGVYDYLKTDVEFFDCTYNATAVTGMAQLYEQAITSKTNFHCYSEADGCNGEGLGSGGDDAINTLLAGCKPSP